MQMIMKGQFARNARKQTSNHRLHHLNPDAIPTAKRYGTTASRSCGNGTTGTAVDTLTEREVQRTETEEENVSVSTMSRFRYGFTAGIDLRGYIYMLLGVCGEPLTPKSILDVLTCDLGLCAAFVAAR